MFDISLRFSVSTVHGCHLLVLNVKIGILVQISTLIVLENQFIQNGFGNYNWI